MGVGGRGLGVGGGGGVEGCGARGAAGPAAPSGKRQITGRSVPDALVLLGLQHARVRQYPRRGVLHGCSKDGRSGRLCNRVLLEEPGVLGSWHGHGPPPDVVLREGLRRALPDERPVVLISGGEEAAVAIGVGGLGEGDRGCRAEGEMAVCVRGRGLSCWADMNKAWQ